MKIVQVGSNSDYNHINECINQTMTGTEGRVVSFEDVRSELARYKDIEQQKKKAAANSHDNAEQRYLKSWRKLPSKYKMIL